MNKRPLPDGETLLSLDTIVSENASPSPEAAKLPEVGTLIADIYRVTGRLGEGAMGVVLLAQDERLHRRVAVKFLRADLGDFRFHARFVEEARAMARVSHPNVVQVHACGEFHGNPYFVMEFIEGQTLEQWIPRHPGDMDGAFRILDGICEGVTAIHAAGTTHRDLKPANVLLDEHLRPKVTDFGLAQRWQDERPVQFEVAGTPAYMAPEVICGDEYERARRPGADVYSLGCLAYEIVTGRPPFQSSQARATLLKHLVDEVLPPSSVCAHSYPELDDAIQRALAKDPTKRTPTAEVFRRDLAAARARAREPARILVADDDDDFRRAIAQLLAESFPGAELECVTDGRQALDAFDRNRPSVAIVDFQMPELDGLQLTERLRSRDPAGSVPIIVLTASAGAPEWQRLAAAGADRLLVKPVSTDDVVAVVRRCLVERVGQARR